MDDSRLAGRRCTGCGRHCPLTDPRCRKGEAQAAAVASEGAPRRLYDSIEEAEAHGHRLHHGRDHGSGHSHGHRRGFGFGGR